MAKVRQATHAGSWYSSDGKELDSQLTSWLSKAPVCQAPARAIIAPHAGYYYCGGCGAHAYRQVDPSRVRRVFILGPSHHVRLSGCALTATEIYSTPLYDLTVDQQINQELYGTGKFETMKISTDEDEHSIEMHLPFIAKVMERQRGQFTIIPVLVGSLSTEKEQDYGALFSRYLADPTNFFVISSDFCHWGQRFHFVSYDQQHGEIWESIKALDSMVSRKVTGNGFKMSFKFVKYEQSSKCKTMRDSSVSYASGALVIEDTNQQMMYK
ncbi:protein MEMO1-like [Ylistrum balloti]|uniref:protein MEMO1-like n=1 Tax=Ylistrum balloti TaxID=509963 RepID=UPI002905B453|nr:protein MEMO1-like [Ylistrum balloti]